MAKNIEVEIRGPLIKDGFNRINKIMEQKGKFIGERDRLSVMYFRTKIPKDLSEIKDDPVDLRVRITNKKAEIVMKYGLWGGSDTRKEFSFDIELNKFEEALEFLKCLNWNIVVVYATRAKTYIYENIEFAIIEIKDYGYSYEAEILVENPKQIPETEKKIKAICKRLGLREYKEEEFEKQCNSINNTKKLQFDFRKDQISSIRKRFNNFFS